MEVIQLLFKVFQLLFTEEQVHLLETTPYLVIQAQQQMCNLLF